MTGPVRPIQGIEIEFLTGYADGTTPAPRWESDDNPWFYAFPEKGQTERFIKCLQELGRKMSLNVQISSLRIFVIGHPEKLEMLHSKIGGIIEEIESTSSVHGLIRSNEGFNIAAIITTFGLWALLHFGIGHPHTAGMITIQLLITCIGYVMLTSITAFVALKFILQNAWISATLWTAAMIAFAVIDWFELGTFVATLTYFW